MLTKSLYPSGVHVAGLREWRWLATARGQVSMPFDYVETPAYLATVQQLGPVDRRVLRVAAVARAVPWGRIGGVDDGRPVEKHELSLPVGAL